MQVPDYYFEQPSTSNKLFKPGDRVTASSSRSVLELDKIYTVSRCVLPIDECPGEPATIFLEGRQYGVNAESLALASYMIDYYRRFGPAEMADILAAQL